MIYKPFWGKDPNQIINKQIYWVLHSDISKIYYLDF